MYAAPAVPAVLDGDVDVAIDVHVPVHVAVAVDVPVGFDVAVGIGIAIGTLAAGSVSRFRVLRLPFPIQKGVSTQIASGGRKLRLHASSTHSTLTGQKQAGNGTRCVFADADQAEPHGLRHVQFSRSDGPQYCRIRYHDRISGIR